MRKLSRREKTVLSLTAGVVVSAAFYHFLLDPFLKRWETFSTEITATQVHLQKTEFFLKQKTEIESELKKYAGSTLSFSAPEEMTTAIFQEVDGMAQANGLKILDMRPLPPRHKDPFMEQGVEVSAEGEAAQFAKFIYGVKESKSPLSVERVELSSKSGQDQHLRGILLVTTLYILKEK